ncbi:hypothetical protein KCU88_g254, partial [Aureobasidium melanogenum]
MASRMGAVVPTFHTFYSYPGSRSPMTHGTVQLQGSSCLYSHAWTYVCTFDMFCTIMPRYFKYLSLYFYFCSYLSSISTPSIPRTRMITPQPRPLPILQIILPRRVRDIIVPKDAAGPKFRKQVFDHILKIARVDRIRDIKAINVRLINPLLQDIRDSLRRSYRSRMGASNRKFLRNSLLRPLHTILNWKSSSSPNCDRSVPVHPPKRVIDPSRSASRMSWTDERTDPISMPVYWPVVASLTTASSLQDDSHSLYATVTYSSAIAYRSSQCGLWISDPKWRIVGPEDMVLLPLTADMEDEKVGKPYKGSEIGI